MIIIPEIETVVILVPRTGTGSIRRAVAATYPKSMLIYRHMEDDGVPSGYDRWRRIGVVRRPLDRLWSLYKFMRGYHHVRPDKGPAYIDALHRSTARPFDDWLLNNETVFSDPHDTAGEGRFFPLYTSRHQLPENRKSQFLYLRPDLGTTVHPFDQIDIVAHSLGIALGRQNATEPEPLPALSPAGLTHIRKFHGWDIEAAGGISSEVSND